MSGEEESDEALVDRAGRGDRIAASMLVNRHSDAIHRLCRRMLMNTAAAEDAAQETFLRLWKSAATWRPQGAKFQTWLYRVATNVCLDALRRRGREVSEDAAPELADGSLSAEASMLADEARLAVEKALADLPERQRLAITLCCLQQLSNTEAAAVMELSVDAVESLLSRGRRSLRAALSSRRDDLFEGMGS